MKMEKDLLGLDEERIAEVARKRSQIAAFLVEKRVDAVLISRHETIAWATAGVVDVRVGVLNDDAFRIERHCVFEMALGVRRQHELHMPIRAGNRHVGNNWGGQTKRTSG